VKRENLVLDRSCDAANYQQEHYCKQARLIAELMRAAGNRNDNASACEKSFNVEPSKLTKMMDSATDELKLSARIRRRRETSCRPALNSSAA